MYIYIYFAATTLFVKMLALYIVHYGRPLFCGTIFIYISHGTCREKTFSTVMSFRRSSDSFFSLSLSFFNEVPVLLDFFFIHMVLDQI
jgi:hypothetical protein